jgi:hypothetical protein
MSQQNVERVIGRIVTDQEFRRRFARKPFESLVEVISSGIELTTVEVEALAELDPTQVEQFAELLDPRIQKIQLPGRKA